MMNSYDKLIKESEELYLIKELILSKIKEIDKLSKNINFSSLKSLFRKEIR